MSLSGTVSPSKIHTKAPQYQVSCRMILLRGRWVVIRRHILIWGVLNHCKLLYNKVCLGQLPPRPVHRTVILPRIFINLLVNLNSQCTKSTASESEPQQPCWIPTPQFPHQIWIKNCNFLLQTKKWKRRLISNLGVKRLGIDCIK